jgi:putative addiction module component (TIGR02574 family)
MLDMDLALMERPSMEHTAIKEPDGFADLPKAEQIRYLQALWDRISEQPEDVPVPASHLEVARERLEAYRRDPTQVRSAFEVFDRLGHWRR